ncbi:glycosyl transferase family 90-domain-containing protein [Suillus clintonianus]|uniref:glycosyl transferase family 90-domain-containing protein n=1 Tax=Suillus clintonianus TaxID=1904413 RepID=UPI001B8840AE|nr:glycosyl transferase family 90-domain-containing protein [Suillus clintonianus]KAG2140698.1 glycosyl transferase family 90-domain-containing protein [Suillus clintonianus]
MGRVVTNKSVACILVACILGATLRNVVFAPPETNMEAVSSLDLDTPTSPLHLFQDYFPELNLVDDTSQVQEERQPAPLGDHYYGDDGLLVVNPNGPHPIIELIERAEQAWEKKLDRASNTLSEAVAEYKRRYRRSPPIHFEKWWEYVVTHNVQLPDEYDEIYQDLEPFWGIDPLDLQTTREHLEAQDNTVVIGKSEQGSFIEVLDYHLPEDSAERLLGRIDHVLQLLQDVEEFLPPFRAVFSPHDNPSMLSDHGVKSMALDAAAARTTVKRNELPMAQRSGWLSACPASSPAWQYSLDPDKSPERPSQKTFISDHRLSMDPCLNPFLFRSHGQFLSHNTGPDPQSTLVPRFSLCSSVVHHDIRPAVPYGWVEDLPDSANPPWEERIDERLLWRGTNTGIFHGSNTRWKEAHRDRMVSYVNDMNGTVDVLRSPLNDSEPVGEPVPLRKAHLNPALLDMQFAGTAGSCSPTLCGQLDRLYDWRKMQTHQEAGRYKYVFDIDGHGWSGRFKRLITSNSLVFKNTIYPEWFMDRVAPWVHYVPVQVDLSDLYDTFTFFRGGLQGEGAHEDLAKKIAAAGREWSKTYWRREDLTAYTFRLFLEYARVSSLDRDAMSYKEET